MNRWISFCVFILFLAAVVFIEGRRSLSFTNSFEFKVVECHAGLKKEVRDGCCEKYCKNATKCFFGLSQEYIYENNNTKEDVCLCYACRPKEWFFNWAKNRKINENGTVILDFSYCSILLPNRANELCDGYCKIGEKCKNGKCAVNEKNERIDRCICNNCPKHDEHFLPVFDPMF